MNPETNQVSGSPNSQLSPAVAQNLLVPTSIRIVSIILIIFGIFDVVADLILLMQSVRIIILLHGDGFLAYLSIFIIMAGSTPSILSIIAGFGLRRLKKWALYLIGIALIITLGRLWLGAFENSSALANSLEPIWYMICVGIYWRHRQKFT